MDTIMTNIAYKVSSGNPNLPDGFVLDHFETEESSVEGFIVVNKAVFDTVFANNVNLLKAHEAKKGIVTADLAAPPPPLRPASDAEPISQSVLLQQQKMVEQETKDAALFREFLAWKQSQG